MDKIWAFGFGSSFFCCLLSVSLCLSLSLSLLPFLRHIHFFCRRERGEEVWIQLMMQFFVELCSACVCVGGGGCSCVRKFPVFLVFCHVEREIMFSWFLFLILKKRSCQSLRDLALFRVIISFYSFFLECTVKYGVSLNQNGAQYRRASRAGSTQRQTNFTLSCHYSKFHSSGFRLILGRLITWALAQFRSSESQSCETNEKWIRLCVFLFLYFWTWCFGKRRWTGAKWSVQFSAIRVLLCYNETILSHCSSFHSGTPVCHEPLAKGLIVCVLQCHILYAGYFKRISTCTNAIWHFVITNPLTNQVILGP